MELEKEVFPGKKISDLVQEVYNRQNNQDSAIKTKIEELSDRRSWRRYSFNAPNQRSYRL